MIALIIACVVLFGTASFFAFVGVRAKRLIAERDDMIHDLNRQLRIAKSEFIKTDISRQQLSAALQREVLRTNVIKNNSALNGGKQVARK